MAANPRMARQMKQNGMGIIQPVIGLDALARVLMSKPFTAEVSYVCLLHHIKACLHPQYERPAICVPRGKELIE